MGDRRQTGGLVLDVESAQPIEEAGYEVFTNLSGIGHCNGGSADR